MNSAEIPKFQNSKSALNQRWFSPKQSWLRAEQRWFSLTQRWKTKNSEQKNQLWISAVSVLIFSETELITTEAFWNSSYHSWFFPETTLNIPEFCVFQFLSSPDFFCNFSPGKLRYYAFWIIISYCFLAANTRFFIFRELLQESSSLAISGNCDLIIFLQKIDLILFPQVFSRKPQILGSLEI